MTERSVWDELTELSVPGGWTLSRTPGPTVQYMLRLTKGRRDDIPFVFYGPTPEDVARDTILGIKNAYAITTFKRDYERCVAILETLHDPDMSKRLNDLMGRKFFDMRSFLHELEATLERSLDDMGAPVSKPEPVNGNVQKADGTLTSA